MNDDTRYARNHTVMIIAILIVVLGPLSAWKWYSAGLQREVYRRQGVEMTQWEVFCGAKPIVRQMVEAP